MIRKRNKLAEEKLFYIIQSRTGISKSQITGNSREEHLVKARCIFYKVLISIKSLGYSKPIILQILNKSKGAGRNMEQVHRNLISTDFNYKIVYDAVWADFNLFVKSMPYFYDASPDLKKIIEKLHIATRY